MTATAAKSQKELQSEQTRARIIAAAIRLFVRRGFSATSIADLAGAINMTKGALYHHFESKEALFLAVIDSIRRTWRDEVGRRVLKAGDALAMLCELLDSHARLIQKNDSFCVVLNSLAVEMEGVNSTYLSHVQAIYADLVRFAERIVSKGQQHGQIRGDLDARLVAVTLVGVLRGTGCSRPAFDGLGVDYAAMTETAKGLILAGLMA